MSSQSPDTAAPPSGAGTEDTTKVQTTPVSEASSFCEVPQGIPVEAERGASGIILDAGREVRIKLYMGMVRVIISVSPSLLNAA